MYWTCHLDGFTMAGWTPPQKNGKIIGKYRKHMGNTWLKTRHGGFVHNGKTHQTDDTPRSLYDEVLKGDVFRNADQAGHRALK